MPRLDCGKALPVEMTHLLGTVKSQMAEEVGPSLKMQNEPQSAQAGDLSLCHGQIEGSAPGHTNFPLLLAAEWDRPERLLKRSIDPTRRRPERSILLSLLGEMQADEALRS
jgi:hypothetical protein